MNTNPGLLITFGGLETMLGVWRGWRVYGTSPPGGEGSSIAFSAREKKVVGASFRVQWGPSPSRGRQRSQTGRPTIRPTGYGTRTHGVQPDPQLLGLLSSAVTNERKMSPIPCCRTALQCDNGRCTGREMFASLGHVGTWLIQLTVFLNAITDDWGCLQ